MKKLKLILFIGLFFTCGIQAQNNVVLYKKRFNGFAKKY
jgi:hypothetical protein